MMTSAMATTKMRTTIMIIKIISMIHEKSTRVVCLSPLVETRWKRLRWVEQIVILIVMIMIMIIIIIITIIIIIIVIITRLGRDNSWRSSRQRCPTSSTR